MAPRSAVKFVGTASVLNFHAMTETDTTGMAAPVAAKSKMDGRAPTRPQVFVP